VWGDVGRSGLIDGGGEEEEGRASPPNELSMATKLSGGAVAAAWHLRPGGSFPQFIQSSAGECLYLLLVLNTRDIQEMPFASRCR